MSPWEVSSSAASAIEPILKRTLSLTEFRKPRSSDLERRHRVVNIAQLCRAILLASATATSILGSRANIRDSQPPSLMARRPNQFSRDIAPIIKSLRISAWPALVMHPKRALPPEECSRGTNPNHAAKSRPVVNCAMSGPNASTATAVSGPTPGMVCRRRARSDWAASAESFAVRSVMRLVFSAICASRSWHSSLISKGSVVAPSSTSAVMRLRWHIPAGNTWPCSYSSARKVFTSAVR